MTAADMLEQRAIDLYAELCCSHWPDATAENIERSWNASDDGTRAHYRQLAAEETQ